MSMMLQRDIVGSKRISRFAMPWYLFPFFINISLIFSATHMLCTKVSADGLSSLTVLSWLLFSVIAVSSPASLAVSQMLPDPSIALATGGLLITSGLLWYTLGSLSTPGLHFYILFVGAGISLSFQAICVSISPYFIRQNRVVSCLLLLLTSLLAGATYPLMVYSGVTAKMIFSCFCPIILLSSFLPLGHYLCSEYRLFRTVPPQCVASTKSFISNGFVHDDSPSQMDSSDTDNNERLDHGWAVSCATVLLWLSWGAGIDTSWMALGWRFEYFKTPSGLAGLQIFLSLLLVAFKSGLLCCQTDSSLIRTNLTSNYMQIGLLGASGLALSVCCDHLILPTFHNNLLFTVGFTLQYDDLSDLYLIRNISLPNSVNYYKLMKYNMNNSWMTPEKKTTGLLWQTLSLACHVVAVFLMSFMAMILGIQVANLLGVLSTVPPLSFLCSRFGLFVMSVAAIAISLTRPDTWIGGRRHHVITN